MTKIRNFVISKIDFNTANLYSSKFNNKNFFTTPKHLNEFNLRIDWWAIHKGKEPLCIWPIYVNEEGRVDIPLFSYYFGPVWSDYYYNLSNHSMLSKKNEVLDIFIYEFKNSYKNLFFQFDYNDLDTRYFIWSNEKNKKKFKILPKYTSVILNLDKKNKDQIFLEFRELRKRMIKKFMKNSSFYPDDNFLYEEILDLYIETIERKKKIVNKEALKFIKIFHKMCQKDNCKIIGYRNKDNNKPASLIMIAHEKDVANLILNLSSHEYKLTGISAFNMFEGIDFAKKLGCKRFDFNGANSEVGADDKQSYGGDSKLYFQVEL